MKKLIVIAMVIFVSALIYAEKNPYEVKSGIIEMKSISIVNGNEVKGTQIYYFDDYGKKIAIRTKADKNMMGQDIPTDSTVISLEKKSYIVDHINKAYIEMLEDEAEEEEDFFDTSEMPEPIKKEKILGKNCDVYSMVEEDEDDGKSLTMIWMWKGLILKQEMTHEMPGYAMKTSSFATNIKLKKVSNDYFEAPKGYSKNKQWDAVQQAMQKHQEEMEKQGYDESGDNEEGSAGELLEGLQGLFGE